jgi:hypothetical protein
MPFPCRAGLLRPYIVSFPFDLHSAAVFDSHMPCRSHAVPLPCLEYAFLKATSQGHGRFIAWLRRQGDGMLTACWRLASFKLYHTQFQSVCYQKHTNLRCSGQCEWHGSGRVVAGERHGMCESVFKAAGEEQGNGMGTAWYV